MQMVSSIFKNANKYLTANKMGMLKPSVWLDKGLENGFGIN